MYSFYSLKCIISLSELTSNILPSVSSKNSEYDSIERTITVGHIIDFDNHPTAGNDIYSHIYETISPNSESSTVLAGVPLPGNELLEPPSNHVKPAWPVAQGSESLDSIVGIMPYPWLILSANIPFNEATWLQTHL